MCTMKFSVDFDIFQIGDKDITTDKICENVRKFLK